MTPTPKPTRPWLLATAKELATTLKQRSEGTCLRIRLPSRATVTDTAGWAAVVGNLGRGQPGLEVWLDRFTGPRDRKLWAGFFSYDRARIIAITARVRRTLWPVRTVTHDDTTKDEYFHLITPLGASGFNIPILEKYRKGATFYGIYDAAHVSDNTKADFCARAVAFFEDVARTLSPATESGEQREVYPRYEKRRVVASHLRRERSGLLATECKIRDEYRCQACGFRFEAAYGDLGHGYAEAHHRVPLAKLRDNVKTHLKDLATVCANCHRMLHRMDGKRDDIAKLKTIVRRRRT